MESISLDELFAIRIQLADYILSEHDIVKKLKQILIYSYNYSITEANLFLKEFYDTYLPDSNITLEMIHDIFVNVIPLNMLSNFNNIPVEPLFEMPINSNLNTINEESNTNDTNSDNESNNDSIDDDNDIEENNNQNIIQTFEYQIPLGDLSNNLNSNMNMISQFLNQLQNSFATELNGAATEEDEFEDILVTIDDKELDSFPKRKLTEKLEEKCSICMVGFDVDDEVYDIKCNHIFHTDCLNTYLKNYGYKCPICRTELGKTKAHH